ncbi:hypothetical protein SCAR479_08688 [Seiridium cardinale]|uniref:Uncharacterized protein n=1 Tax=Seiridium cardinale TaxID=138064 RepID=A0ABR2XLD4_9PEZI
MPRRATSTTTEEQDIWTLCRFMMCADSFKGVSARFAQVTKSCQAKSVPRKINAIINQYGYEFKGGKVLPMPNAPRVRANLFSAAAATPAAAAPAAACAPARAPARPATRAAALAHAPAKRKAKRKANREVKRASAPLKKRKTNMLHTNDEDEDEDDEI